MKIAVSLFSLCFITLMSSAALQAADHYDYGHTAQGFSETPFMPGTAWRIQTFARPRPPKVESKYDGKIVPAPEGAVQLFDGSKESLQKNWQNQNWTVRDGYMTPIKKGEERAGDQASIAKFGSQHLHVEFATPPLPADKKAQGQGLGNSGVFIMGGYEIQVLDSYSSETYADGQCASAYAQTPPLVNACAKPEEWQSYDIYFKAPKWKDGKLINPPWVTVYQNGHLVQDNTLIISKCNYKVVGKLTPHADKEPLRLQDHNNHVRFRNIWVNDLKEDELAKLGYDAWARSGKHVRDAFRSVDGWTDTPMLPNSQWRVSDLNRPLPHNFQGLYNQRPVRAAEGAKMLLSTNPSTLDNWNNNNWKKTYKRGVVYKVEGNFTTKEEFGDAFFHLEFATQWPTPALPNSARSNSGIFLMGDFEVQILDSYQNPSFADGQCCAIYAQTPCRYNVSGHPGDWQSVDILFKAPVIKDGKVSAPARISVFHNNVLVHNNVEILGPVRHKALASYKGYSKSKGPFMLQAHPGEVRFRNIWMTPLQEDLQY